MQIGKIPESILKSTVFGKLPKLREEVLLGSGIGEDCAALQVSDDEIVVLSTDPITGATKDAGRLACIVTINDLASSGAETVGLLLTVLLPPDSGREIFEEIMEDVSASCTEHNVSLIGGHTEVTDAVNRPLISVTGVGKVKKDALIKTSDAKPGMELLVTKWVGIEGTSIIAKEREKELLKHYPRHMVEGARAMDKYLSVAKEGLVAAANGAKSMHDVTEGGILGALWEMAEASSTGLEVDLTKVPVRQETVEICEYFDLNPYKLISSGCMLIATDEPDRVAKALEEIDIPVTSIGHMTEGPDRVVLYDDRQRYLTPPDTDELYKI